MEISWKNNTGKGILIAVIDTGVNDKHPQLIEFKISGVELCEEDEKIKIKHDSFNDTSGHGTAVTHVIKQTARDADIFVVKIYSDLECNTTFERLYAGLEYVKKTVKPDIVHISSGIVECDDIPALRQICSEIVDQGSIITAAFDNMGSISYPAAFPDVIGVDWYKECIKINDYIYLENGSIDIMGYGLEQKLAWLDGWI